MTAIVITLFGLLLLIVAVAIAVVAELFVSVMSSLLNVPVSVTRTGCGSVVGVLVSIVTIWLRWLNWLELPARSVTSAV